MDRGAEDAEDQAARNDGSDLAGNVRADRVHEQEVLIVLLLAHLVDDAGAHRECGDAACADHRIDLLLSEQIYEFGEEHAADGIENECHETEAEHLKRVRMQEVFRAHGRGDRDAEEDRDEVREHFLRRFGDGIEHAAFADQVAEHEAADKQ